MLVLGRALGQEVWIETPEGRFIRVVVVDFRRSPGGRQAVRIGFDADAEVKVDRSEIVELREQIAKEGQPP